MVGKPKSQRITDVVLKAFQACAASQGDCNNLTFGYGGNSKGETEVKGFGYYETIAGGSGAVRLPIPLIFPRLKNSLTFLFRARTGTVPQASTST